ncbi:MAG: site-specific integrase [Rhodocyclaceae bacterium]|nr:site-specific integrase [Rhodocyclaceae bacterium]
MATIRKRGNKWQARVQRHGVPEQSRSFLTRLDAEQWARAIETEIDRGVFVSIKEAERTTLADMLLRYAAEVSPTKRAAKEDAAKLKMLARMKVAKLSLVNLTPKAIAAHRDERLKVVSTGTVLRDLAVMRSVLNHARRQWGFAIENPVERVRMPPAPLHRDRVLSEDEELRLLEILTPGLLRGDHGRFASSTRNTWVRPMTIFAIETAMRRGEILSLTWKDVDLQRRVAYLPITKNGRPRAVPLSSRALSTLGCLPRSIDGRVFPVARWTVEQVFEGACSRAGIENLRWHDLRHTATSRLAKKVPNVIELAAITGHSNVGMLKRYYHITAEELALKIA